MRHTVNEERLATTHTSFHDVKSALVEGTMRSKTKISICVKSHTTDLANPTHREVNEVSTGEERGSVLVEGGEGQKKKRRNGENINSSFTLHTHTLNFGARPPIPLPYCHHTHNTHQPVCTINVQK